MKRIAIVIAIGVLSACSRGGDPNQTAVCEGHGSIVTQHSENDFSSAGFTGKATCSDGRTEFWIDGVLDGAIDP